MRKLILIEATNTHLNKLSTHLTQQNRTEADHKFRKESENLLNNLTSRGTKIKALLNLHLNKQLITYFTNNL